MPRQPRKTYKQQANDTHRFCNYCKTNRDRRRFEKHQAACKVLWQIRHKKNDPKNQNRRDCLERQDEEPTRTQETINSLGSMEVSILLHIYMPYYILITFSENQVFRYFES